MLSIIAVASVEKWALCNREMHQYHGHYLGWNTKDKASNKERSGWGGGGGVCINIVVNTYVGTQRKTKRTTKRGEGCINMVVREVCPTSSSQACVFLLKPSERQVCGFWEVTKLT